jgi:hypothetical protein
MRGWVDGEKGIKVMLRVPLISPLIKKIFILSKTLLS